MCVGDTSHSIVQSMLMTLPSRAWNVMAVLLFRVLTVVVRGLADALFVGDDLVFLRVEVVGAGLQHVAEDALLVVLLAKRLEPSLPSSRRRTPTMPALTSTAGTDSTL